MTAPISYRSDGSDSENLSPKPIASDNDDRNVCVIRKTLCQCVRSRF